MAILGSTTLTGCDSIPDFIDTGSVTVFNQSASPTSWTRVSTEVANNRMLRVISTGVGIGTGGTASPILNDVVASHTHGFTSGGHSVDHSHSGTTSGQSVDHTHVHSQWAITSQLGFPTAGSNGGLFIGQVMIYGAGTGNLNTGGISANHTHTFTTAGASVGHTHSATTDNGSSQTNWQPRYIDSLFCSKN